MEREAKVMYVTDKQLAIRYGVHKVTIWNWVKNENFPCPKKLHGCTRWLLSEVENWEQQKKDSQ